MKLIAPRLWFLATIMAAAPCAGVLAQSPPQIYPDRRAIVVNTSSALEVSGFVMENQGRPGGERFVARATWHNTGQQPIVAFEMVLLKFDAFNRRMAATRWTVPGRSSVDWTPLPPNEAASDGVISLASEAVFTGILYVRQIRWKDGTIWRADDAQVLAKAKQAAPELTDFGSLAPDPKATQ